MTSYTVHLPPQTGSGRLPGEDARFIPERPAVLALVFPALWLLLHRLWYALALYLVAVAAISIVTQWSGSDILGLLSVLPGFYLLLEGRQLLRGRLERLGWRLAGVVEADTPEDAEWRYFSANAGDDVTGPAAPGWTPAEGTSPVRTGEEAPAIGIFGR
ncbi:MAG: DUF2628 domain-containing protein [Pseudomonadota bacterium]|nr:DUF2628 domain-containing protein [Pseudomonadota bacterium]